MNLTAIYLNGVISGTFLGIALTVGVVTLYLYRIGGKAKREHRAMLAKVRRGQVVEFKNGRLA